MAAIQETFPSATPDRVTIPSEEILDEGGYGLDTGLLDPGVEDPIDPTIGRSSTAIVKETFPAA